MADKYLDLNGLSIYDSKIKNYIGDKDKLLSDRIDPIDGLSVENEDTSGYNNIEVYNTKEVDYLIKDNEKYVDAKVAEISAQVNDYIKKITSTNAASAASQISYDDSTSQVGATTVQNALEQIDSSVDALSNDLNTVKQSTGLSDFEFFSTTKTYSIGDIINYNGVIYEFTMPHPSGAWNGNDARQIRMTDAKFIKYDNTASQMSSTNVQNAIDEIKTSATQANEAITTQLDGKINKTDIADTIGDTASSNKVTSQKCLAYYLMVYDTTLGKGTKFSSLQNAIDSVPQSFQKGGLTIQTILEGNDDFTFYTLKGKDWSDDIINWYQSNITTASLMPYDNTIKNILEASTVQEAIDELATKVNALTTKLSI